MLRVGTRREQLVVAANCELQLPEIVMKRFLVLYQSSTSAED
jgi:hypothetical protein